jgi:hypothetical protein
MTLRFYGLGRPLVAGVACFVITAMPGPGALSAQTETGPDQIAAIKQSMAESQQLLRQYEWIETTAISVKGKEKSRQQNRCYYGADGALQKVPATGEAGKDGKPGRVAGRVVGKIKSNKKEDMAEYLEQAAALMKSYLPPDPAKLQASKQAGKMSVDVLEPGKRVRVNFADYAKPGDKLGLELDVADNRLLGLAVASYMDDAKDAVQLDGKFALLDNGATYPKQFTLNAPAKNITVTVENSGYRKTVP